MINNAGSSNTVTEPLYATTPGVFTNGGTGLGYGAAEHLNGSYVTQANPAQPGETVQIYLSGLGTVNPPLTVQGGAGPASSATYPQQITAYIGMPTAIGPPQLTSQTNIDFAGMTQATMSFAGLAPTLAGLYQVDLTIPFNAVAGDNVVGISGLTPVSLGSSTYGTDSYNLQALIPVGSGTGASARQPVPKTRQPFMPSSARRSKPCFLYGATQGCKN